MNRDFFFEDVYELDIVAHKNKDLVDPSVEDPPIYNQCTLWGYKKGIDNFFKIFWLFKTELGFIFLDEFSSNFDNILTFLAGGFLSDFEKNNNLDEILIKSIQDLKKFKFITNKPKNPFLKYHSHNMLDLVQKEITVSHISRIFSELRQRRIEFYEIILQKYLIRKDEYNKELRKHLDSNSKLNLNEKRRDTHMGEMPKLQHLKDFNLEYIDENIFTLETYELGVASYHLSDLEPDIDKATDLDLEAYRDNVLWGYKEGIDLLFDIFSIFKEEMSYMRFLGKKDLHIFEKTRNTLIGDFLANFEEISDLEGVLTDYIENLEKFSFSSLDKDTFIDRFSRAIYNMRQRRIEFYEAILHEYLANKKKYNESLQGYLKRK
ncbi:MAG: hypothetical protein ACFFG0_37615 [Candidatus Thorarchaeota archaeon]